MRATSRRRTATRTRYGRKPTTPPPCTHAGICSRACATSRRTRCARDSPRVRAPTPGRATAPTRSGRTTRSSPRTRITTRWGARPTSAAWRTRRCSRGLPEAGIFLRDADAPSAQAQYPSENSHPNHGDLLHEPSIDSRAAFLRDPRPLRDVGLDELGEFIGRVADRLEAEGSDALLHLLELERLDDLVVQLGDDGLGRSRGSEQAVPSERLEPRQ